MHDGHYERMGVGASSRNPGLSNARPVGKVDRRSTRASRWSGPGHPVAHCVSEVQFPDVWHAMRLCDGCGGSVAGTKSSRTTPIPRRLGVPHDRTSCRHSASKTQSRSRACRSASVTAEEVIKRAIRNEPNPLVACPECSFRSCRGLWSLRNAPERAWFATIAVCFELGLPSERSFTAATMHARRDAPAIAACAVEKTS